LQILSDELWLAGSGEIRLKAKTSHGSGRKENLAQEIFTTDGEEWFQGMEAKREASG